MRECIYDRIFFKLLIQRVSFADVKIQNNSRGQIQKGLFILVGFGHNLTNSELDNLKVKDLLNVFFNVFKKAIDKVFLLRVFPDEKSKMSKSVLDIKGGVYLVSQFTLFSDCKKGNRPSFTKALPEHLAKPMY